MNLPRKPDTKPNFRSPQIEHGEYYYLDLDADQENTPKISCGGFEHCSLDYCAERIRSKYYGIEYIVAGTCHLTINGEESELNPGGLFSYAPNCRHRIVNTGDIPLVKYFVDFTGDGCDLILESAMFQCPRAYNLTNSNWIAHAFQDLQECGMADDPHSKEICGHLLYYLIARIDSVEERKNHPSTPSYTTFEHCKSYMESNYSNIVSAHEVAEMFHISHQYLCRLFKRFCEETPSQMLTRLKLTRSVSLLTQGNLLVKEIAEKVGFEDQYYFSKRFKSYFGVSPKNYAKRNGDAMIA